ncbi:hypothetical protein SRABI112_04311 [Pseudomonas mediterranea]|nr:hypothetical protein SRABI112_04311 [Pseudomonas mediterranea]
MGNRCSQQAVSVRLGRMGGNDVQQAVFIALLDSLALAELSGRIPVGFVQVEQMQEAPGQQLRESSFGRGRRRHARQHLPALAPAKERQFVTELPLHPFIRDRLGKIERGFHGPQCVLVQRSGKKAVGLVQGVRAGEEPDAAVLEVRRRVAEQTVAHDVGKAVRGGQHGSTGLVRGEAAHIALIRFDVRELRCTKLPGGDPGLELADQQRAQHPVEGGNGGEQTGQLCLVGVQQVQLPELFLRLGIDRFWLEYR